MIQLISGEILQLLPQRAAYWPREKMLIIADIHFGKAAAFRAKGVPVPHGTTDQNLQELDNLLRQFEVSQILFLGDFLHAKTARAPATLAALHTWRATHPDLHLILVRGNHDLHAGDPPATLRMQMVDEPHQVGAFTFCHHPAPLPDTYVLAGHVHPVYRLAAANDRLRLPCFVIGERHAILPSFGAFTGGFAVTPAPGERVMLIADDRVFAVPAMPGTLPRQVGRL
ncbi:ligase-associated DNA damage response endonuclease PdeM [Actimicrobium antarcticum]|uniref:Ligase-associated DNA damage response endonuclease PdeM n=1 Tax=Actimicrobium antarcticum TaxID=1051899 RepID=A0ABP7SW90_9BURK